MLFKKEIVFVHTLNLAAFLWLLIRSNKIDKVCYVSSNINCWLMRVLNTNMSLEQINDQNDSPKLIQNEKNLYNFTEKLFQLPGFLNEISSVLKEIQLKTENLITALKKNVLTSYGNDVTIITIALASGEKHLNKCVLVKQYELLSETACNDIRIMKIYSPVISIKTYLSFIKIALMCLKRIFYQNAKNSSKNEFKKINIIFEPSYSVVVGNPEFSAFYRYFKQRDDVLYLCEDNGEIYDLLEADHKQVLVKSEIHFPVQGKAELFMLFVRLILKLLFSLKLKSLIVKLSILSMFYSKMLYETLFEKYTPSCFLKIRSDYFSIHPVITAVADKYNVKHIGYQHGSYSFFQGMFAHIDFHYYGLLGKCFRDEPFSETWPKKIKYRVLGPFAIEIEDKKHYKNNTAFVIGVFVSAYNESQKSYPLQENLECVCGSLNRQNIPNLHVIFKEKFYTEWSDRLITGLCKKYSLSYEIAYSSHPLKNEHIYPRDVIEGADKHGMNIHINPSKVNISCSAQKAMGQSEIIIVLSAGCSTASWEAIGKKKKLIVFVDQNILHPFEKYQPKLIVRDQKDFEDSIKWLLSISQREYEKHIHSTIENYCKVSDGNLVKDFIESIEQESNIKSQK